MKLTDGTMLDFIAVDVATNGDTIFGTNEPIHEMAMIEGATKNTLPFGWSLSDVRTYCNGEFLNLLPSTVKNGIKKNTKKYAKTTGNNTSSGYMYEIETVTDSIWIPSLYEILGNDKSTTLTYPGMDTLIAEEKWFDLYATGETLYDRNYSRRNFGTLEKLKSWTSTAGGKISNYPGGFYGMIYTESGNTGAINDNNAKINEKRYLNPHFIIGAQ